MKSSLKRQSSRLQRSAAGSALSQRGTHVTWQVRFSFSLPKRNRVRPPPQQRLPLRSRRMPRAISRVEGIRQTLVSNAAVSQTQSVWVVPIRQQTVNAGHKEQREQNERSEPHLKTKAFWLDWRLREHFQFRHRMALRVIRKVNQTHRFSRKKRGGDPLTHCCTILRRVHQNSFAIRRAS